MPLLFDGELLFLGVFVAFTYKANIRTALFDITILKLFLVKLIQVP